MTKVENMKMKCMKENVPSTKCYNQHKALAVNDIAEEIKSEDNDIEEESKSEDQNAVDEQNMHCSVNKNKKMKNKKFEVKKSDALDCKFNNYNDLKGDFGHKISKSLDGKSVPKKKIENRKEVEEHIELACECVNCAKKVRIESLKHGCIQMIDEIKREQDKSIDLQDWSKIEELRTRICDFQKYKNHVLKEMNQIKENMNVVTNQKSAGETCKVSHQTAID